ncbi:MULTISPECIES: low-specificity L-threonine aldolase [unclassified Clostridium]|uniref:low-specificity L-threonine aldolase n=1 Tax=unclassified Clostridium TaxID=2614128 RepID=UPI002A83733D|nr:low-specificity L-threonine aldolase [Clostridium sp.]MDY4252173.1 low-specificity L-threonine aldolase [Clostridium sp.]MDY6228924.1 low-specificity L-threonine aldolase [Clostridium sp.]
MKFIDLRSDTVTEQPIFMKEAMFNAEVGDDVYRDDPTVIKLEKLAAEIVGMESALFVPSGTFGNQLALFTHCKRGSEVIIADSNHIIAHEVGASSVIAGVQLRTIDAPNGVLNPNEIEKRIRFEDDDIHFPSTSLICVENAHSSGNVLSIENMKAVYDIAKKYNLPVHLDGARLFNASTALNVDVKEITKYCDSVMFCLSKGLCSPVGSILAGSKDFIDKARKKRKLMGGGLRQAGFLAAAGIVSLEVMTKRLKEDHDNAKLLAEELSKIPEIYVDLHNLKINMVFFSFKDKNIDTKELVKYFLENNIKINDVENGLMRFVTHYWVTKDDIYKIIEVLKTFLYER